MGIVFELVRSGRSDAGVDGGDPLGREGSHVQPDGSRTGAAVINERDGALGKIFDVGTDVGREEEQGFGLVLFVFEEQAADGGLVRNGLTADLDGVVGDGRFFLWRGRGGFGGLFGRLRFFLLGQTDYGGEREQTSGSAQQGQTSGRAHS